MRSCDVGATKRSRWDIGLFAFTPKEAVIVGLAAAVVQVGKAIARVSPADVDFAIFHLTTQRFLNGVRMYSGEHVDFTPPLFHALIWPLATLDARSAFIVWTLANLALAWLVMRIILHEVPDVWARHRYWMLAACVVNAAGVQATLRLGQVSWLVAIMIACAWRAARSSRWAAVGCWTGLAIAFKPFLLLALPVFLVRRRWTAVAVCLPAIALSCFIGIAVFGWTSFTDWIGNLRTVPGPKYLTYFLNASWPGVAARAHLPPIFAIVGSGVLVAVLLWRVRFANEDDSWLLLLIASLLVSPLGWIYYQPMLIGPALAVVISGRIPHPWWFTAAWMFPPIGRTFLQQESVAVAVSLGSIYFWGLFAAFVVLAIAARADDPAHADAPLAR